MARVGVIVAAALAVVATGCSAHSAKVNPVGQIGELSQATPAQVHLGAVNGAKSGVAVVRGAAGVVDVVTGGPGPSCTSHPLSARRLAADSVLIVMSEVPTGACFFSFHEFVEPVSFAAMDGGKPLHVTIVVSGQADANDIALGQTPPAGTLRWVLRPAR